MAKERGNVWLGAAALVINAEGEWLVVQKNYSGSKGRWTLPAGFTDAGETVDATAVREVKEETGIDCEIIGLMGIRSGVIRHQVSDNMMIFLARKVHAKQELAIDYGEMAEVAWLKPSQLVADERTSAMLLEIAEQNHQQLVFNATQQINPGAVFGYSAYKLFM